MKYVIWALSLYRCWSTA